MLPHSLAIFASGHIKYARNCWNTAGARASIAVPFSRKISNYRNTPPAMRRTLQNTKADMELDFFPVNWHTYIKSSKSEQFGNRETRVVPRAARIPTQNGLAFFRRQASV